MNPYVELSRVISSAAEYVGYALTEIRRVADKDGILEDKVYDAFLHLRDAEDHCHEREESWDNQD